jgi:hypothetical protein
LAASCHFQTHAVQQIAAYSITSPARSGLVGDSGDPQSISVTIDERLIAVQLEVG